jgi:hypothetical protein
MKMLSGKSAGEVLGFASYTFKIWDLDNDRAAEYTYRGPIRTVGTPVSISGEGAWSAPFTTPAFIQVDQFAGRATHATAGATATPKPVPPGFPAPPALSVSLPMAFSFEYNPHWGVKTFTVIVPTGTSKITSAGGETGRGDLALVSGSVEVFSGP